MSVTRHSPAMMHGVSTRYASVHAPEAGTLALVALVGVACGFLVAAFPSDASVMVVASILAGTAYVVLTRSSAPERAAVGTVFLLAFGLRVLVMVVLHHTVFRADPSLLAGDDLAYDRIGLAIADRWRESGPSLAAWPDYRDLTGLILYLGSDNLLLPRLFNAFAGSLAVVFTALTAGRLFGPRAALRVGLIAALFPSLIVWSSLNLKEGWALLALSLVGYGLVSVRSSGWTTSALPIVTGLLLLSVIRSWLLFVVAAGLLIGSLAAMKRSRAKLIGTLTVVGLTLWGLMSLGVADQELDTVQSRSVEEIRSSTTRGGSALEEGIDLSSPVATLGSAPIALVTTTLGPFPWAIVGERQALALPEMIAWYVIFPLVILGVIRARRRVPAEATQLAVLAGTILVALAVIEGNLGLIYRHRLQALILLFVFVGAVDRSAAMPRAVSHHVAHRPWLRDPRRAG